MAVGAASEVSFVEASRMGRNRTAKNMIDRLSSVRCL